MSVLYIELFAIKPANKFGGMYPDKCVQCINVRLNIYIPPDVKDANNRSGNDVNPTQE